MTVISATASTEDIDRAVASLGRLSHLDPRELWAFIVIARRNLEDEMFWQTLHDGLVQGGASVAAADSWVNGMKSLAAGRYP
jgi:hypothetical protein